MYAPSPPALHSRCFTHHAMPLRRDTVNLTHHLQPPRHRAQLRRNPRQRLHWRRVLAQPGRV
jgi:hypothetical protein